MADIYIEGLDALEKKLGRINALNVLGPPMVRSMARLHGYMATYPPPPPASRYRRTGLLGRSWQMRVENSGTQIVGVLGNPTPYGPFVQAAAMQAEVHRGRWRTDEMAIEKNGKAIIADFQRSIAEALK